MCKKATILTKCSQKYLHWNPTNTKTKKLLLTEIEFPEYDSVAGIQVTPGCP